MSSRFDFRQKPTGVFKWFLKTPGLLFRAKLGFLFGERILMITHVGRNSGTTFHTPLEVVVHDTASAGYIVCSGNGPGADWHRNILARPASSVQVGIGSGHRTNACLSRPRRPTDSPTTSAATRERLQSCSA